MNYKNHKEIDNFLLAIDKFIEKYHCEDENKINADIVFGNIIKAHSYKRYTLPIKKELDIPNLVKMCNRVKNNDIAENRRTDSFVRNTAYSMEYKYIKDLSYEHILWKFIYNNVPQARAFYPYNKIYEGYLDKFQDSLSSFLIFDDWDINTDLIIN